MLKNILTRAIAILLFINVVNITASTEIIKGKVIDAKTKEPLPGANVLIVGTGFGVACNVDGEYIIKNVPAGSYTIKVSYIGYESKEAVIEVGDEKIIELDFELLPVSIEGEEIIITAQASGQKAAINQQLSSDRIVNIVSSEKIQALPDANAAESVGRLPGVSVLRNGGEGTQVVIRGLSPKFNQITVNGVELASSNPDDRSTDISMITPNILGSIEVSKTITSDMDANVIGGIVNFELKEARSKKDGELPISLIIQGGYNDLSNAYNKFNNYKYLLNVEDRFFDARFGVMAQINVERRNLTSNDLNVSYEPVATNFTDYRIQSMNLSYNYRDIQRYNAALVMDYEINNGKIKFTNFFNYGKSNTLSRVESYNISGNYIDFINSGFHNKSYSMNNSLEFDKNLPFLTLEANISHSYSEVKSPNNWTLDFLQNSGGMSSLTNKPNIDPEIIQQTAVVNLQEAYMNYISTTNDFSKDDNWSASLDLSKDYRLGFLVTGKLKFGALYRYQNKTFDSDVYDGGGLQYGGASFVNSLIKNYFSLPQDLGYQIPITYFPDNNFNYGKFLDGQFQMLYPVNVGTIPGMYDYLKSNYSDILENNGWSAFVHDMFLSTTNDYKGKENRSALYVMTNINVGAKLNIIVGMRYQNLRTEYTGVRGIQTRGSVLTYNHYDTTVTKSYGYLLPNLSIKYQLFDWLDIRGAYTNTLAYPDFQAIIPRIDVGSGEISWNNFNLEPSRSTNYDFYLTFHDNTLGFLSVGGFLKNISKLIYPWSFYVSGDKAIPYYPPALLADSKPSGNYKINTYINNSEVIKDYGIEADWQTHFWYLPGVLSGIVLSVNYTHILSEATYPYTLIKSTGRKIVYIDTTFSDRLLYQPDNILNISLGYDYKDFSIRIAMIYQDDIFTGVNFWPQIRTNTASYQRWDIAFKQTLPWYNLELYGAINNINGASDKIILQKSKKISSIQDYGASGYIGIRWNFNNN